MNIAIFVCFVISCFSITMSDDSCSHYNLANGCACALNELNGKTWSIVILVDSTIGSITDVGFEAVNEKIFCAQFILLLSLGARISPDICCQFSNSR